MSWICLILAGLFEIVWAVGIKYCDGFKPTIALFVVIGAMIASMTLLAIAVRNMPISIAYAVWTGIGTVGVAIFGIVFLHEAITPLGILFLLLIVCGLIGLKLISG